MSNLDFPAFPIHPGEILKDEFRARRLSQKYFAEVTGIPYTMLNDVLNARRPISTDFALTMEAALNISAEMLINMQMRYNLQIARRDEEKAKRWDELSRICAALL